MSATDDPVGTTSPAVLPEGGGSPMDLPPVIHDTFMLLDEQWRFVYLNREALRVAGEPAEAVLGRVIWEKYPGLLGTPLEAAYRRAMGERTAVRVEFPGVSSGRHYEIHAFPARPGLAVYGRDITRRTRAEERLRESEARFRAQYDGLPVPTYTWRRGAGPGGDDFTLISFNKAGDAATDGYVRRLVGRRVTDLYADQPEIVARMRECYEQRAPVRAEMRYRLRSTGEVLDLLMTYVYVPPDLVMIHAEDVTDRKAAERQLRELNETLERRVAEQTARLRESEEHYRRLAERNQHLARELEHRVGNHLAAILSLVSAMRAKGVDSGCRGGQTAAQGGGDGAAGGAAGPPAGPAPESAAAFAAALEGRLTAMAEVHKLLAASGWLPLDVRTLVQSLLAAVRPMSPHECRVATDGPAADVGPDQALPLAIILVEWFTNACKYGACSVPGGHVEVGWEVSANAADTADGGGPRLRLTWRERGGPVVAQPIVPSLGTDLVRGLAARELGGSVWLGYPPEGADHRLEIPLDGRRGDSPAAAPAARTPRAPTAPG